MSFLNGIESLEAKEASNAFTYACREVSESYKGISDGEELERKIREKFKNFFDNPPITTIELIIGKRFTLQEVQIALFRPMDEQIMNTVDWCYTALPSHRNNVSQ